MAKNHIDLIVETIRRHISSRIDKHPIECTQQINTSPYLRKEKFKFSGNVSRINSEQVHVHVTVNAICDFRLLPRGAGLPIERFGVQFLARTEICLVRDFFSVCAT